LRERKKVIFMYQVGELVLYGSTGVCKVEEIREQNFPSTGEKRLYYTLRPLYEDCVISVPVDSDKVFIRPIISREEAERLIAGIPKVRVEMYHSRVSRELTEHYEAILRSHDCGSLVELTMSIYAKKQSFQEQKRKFGTVDERFLKRAEDLLFGELAAALEIPKDQVQGYIASKLEYDKAVG